VTIWYSSDPHFFHVNILAYCGRPFADVTEMNAAIVDRWNSVVKPGDTVWVLGDVALSPNNLAPVAQLNGRKALVAGNHDSCWDRHKRWQRHVQTYHDAGFDAVITSGVVDRHFLHGGIPVRLSHLPYSGDSHHDDRYADRRPVDDGLPLLCGHVHDKWRIKDRMLNVGVDVHDFYPVSEDAVIEMIKEMPDAG
jgi:calcineurin-like phosphoesterase family protein